MRVYIEEGDSVVIENNYIGKMRLKETLVKLKRLAI